MPFDRDLRAREHVGRLPQLLEQPPIRRAHDVLAALKRQAHEPNDHAITFARHARLVARKHVLDRGELLADTRLGLEPLHERDALLRYAAEPLVEIANLFLELADAGAGIGEIALGLSGLLAQPFDVGDEVRRRRARCPCRAARLCRPRR